MFTSQSNYQRASGSKDKGKSKMEKSDELTLKEKLVSMTTVLVIKTIFYVLFGADGRLTSSQFSTVFNNKYPYKIWPLNANFTVNAAFTGTKLLLENILMNAKNECDSQSPSSVKSFADIVKKCVVELSPPNENLSIAVGGFLPNNEGPQLYLIKKEGALITMNSTDCIRIGTGGSFLPTEAEINTWKEQPQSLEDIEFYGFKNVRDAAMNDWRSGGNVYTTVVYIGEDGNIYTIRAYREPKDAGNCRSNYSKPHYL